MVEEHLALERGDVIRIRQQTSRELEDIGLDDGLHAGDYLLRYVLEVHDDFYLTQGLLEDGQPAGPQRRLSQLFIDRFAKKLVR